MIEQIISKNTFPSDADNSRMMSRNAPDTYVHVRNDENSTMRRMCIIGEVHVKNKITEDRLLKYCNHNLNLQSQSKPSNILISIEVKV